MYVNRVKGTKNGQRVIIFNAAEANLVFFALREQMVFECPDPHHCTDKSIYFAINLPVKQLLCSDWINWCSRFIA